MQLSLLWQHGLIGLPMRSKSEWAERGEAMMGVTVDKLAELIGDISPEKLIEQLKDAGVQVSATTDLVTEEDRQKLLSFLKKEHGAEGEEQPKKISLKRKSISEIKVKSASGKNSVVSVVRKRRRVYVKKDAPDEENNDAESAVADAASGVEDAVANNENVAEELTTTTPVDTEATTPEVQDEAGSESEEAPAADSKEAASVTKSKTQADTTEKSKKKSTANKSKATAGTAPAPDIADQQQQENKSNRKSKSTKGRAGSDNDTVKEKRKSKSRLLEESQGQLRGGKKKAKAKAAKFQQGSQKSRGKSAKAAEEEVNPHAFARPTEPIIYEVKIPETIVVSELARQMSIKAAEVIKVMMKMGAMATINQVIDQDTACIVVEEMGHKAVAVKDVSIEESLNIEYEEDVKTRSPIVTVMGHVDHGKTSLLDYIRRASMTSQEAGGITQHIGAYQVETPRGVISFLDTPGHSAFTAMRARGADCTDLVVLVVAADDGVMPQTIEAIQHAKAANVPIIVAVNKVDKPEADVDKVTNELSQYDLIPESWGGDTMFVQVSAKVGTGIDSLLESIMIQAELLELTAPYSGLAQGIVIEARVDRGRGPVSTVLVQRGLLKQGDMVLAGFVYGRIKSMANDKGIVVAHAEPSMPVEVLGLSGAPQAGDKFQVVEDERKAREVALFRQGKHREIKLSRQQASKLEGFMDRMQQSDVKELNIVLKADVQGSVEALREALENLSKDEIRVKIIGQGVGGFNESDINLAMASQAVLIGFNIRAEASARKLAQQEGIEIHYYSVIYDVIDCVKRAISGKLGPKYTQRIVGLAEVRDVFRSAKIGAIAGCMVIDGNVKRGYPIRVLRDNVVIYEGELESLRRFKDSVADVRNGMECGIGVKNYNDVKVGDQIEVFETVEIDRDET